MWLLPPRIKRHRGIGFVLVAILAVSLFAQVQMAQAIGTGASCVSGKALQPHHTKSHSCCGTATSAAAKCDCAFEQGGPAQTTEQALVPSSSLPNPSDTIVAISTDAAALSFNGRHASSITGVMTRGPTVKVYLQTLNLIC